MSLSSSILAVLGGACFGAAYGLVHLALGAGTLALIICPILFALIVLAGIAIAAPTPRSRKPTKRPGQRGPRHTPTTR